MNSLLRRPLVESTATGLGQWMAATVDDNQWAGLDRDVQTAMATVAGSLPFDLSLAIAATDSPEGESLCAEGPIPNRIARVHPTGS